MNKVVLEIQIDAKNPLDAAKKFAEMLIEDANSLIYVVQDEETNKISSVDLSEEDENAVLAYDDYQPLISL